MGLSLGKVFGGVASAIGIGLPAMMISSGSSALTGLAGMLGGGQGGPLPQPQMGQMAGQSPMQSSGDMGYQQSIAGLMQMIGQQPTISGSSQSGLLVGGGGLI